MGSRPGLVLTGVAAGQALAPPLRPSPLRPRPLVQPLAQARAAHPPCFFGNAPGGHRNSCQHRAAAGACVGLVRMLGALGLGGGAGSPGIFGAAGDAMV